MKSISVADLWFSSGSFYIALNLFVITVSDISGVTASFLQDNISADL